MINERFMVIKLQLTQSINYYVIYVLSVFSDILAPFNGVSNGVNNFICYHFKHSSADIIKNF